jgi:hypothetical protein
VNTVDPTCALCKQPVGPGAASHAVRGKVICEACRRLVVAAEPRQVLPYADAGTRRRRWLLPAAGALGAVLLLVLALTFVARQAAVQRARAEEMRALLAERQARLAAQQAVAAQMRAQRPATAPVE